MFMGKRKAWQKIHLQIRNESQPEAASLLEKGALTAFVLIADHAHMLPPPT